jgi:hypothetical protein
LILILRIAFRYRPAKAARAALAAQHAGIPALAAEVEGACLVLNTPAAHLMHVARSDLFCSTMLKHC